MIDVKTVELYCSGTRDPGPVRGESVLYSSVKYDCLAARGAPPAEGKLLHQGRHPDRRGGHVGRCSQWEGLSAKPSSLPGDMVSKGKKIFVYKCPDFKQKHLV